MLCSRYFLAARDLREGRTVVDDGSVLCSGYFLAARDLKEGRTVVDA